VRVNARSAQAEADHETVLRVRATLDGFLASHGPHAVCSVAFIRDLLDPRGLWSLDPQRRRGQREKEQPPELPPGADPITHCLPVTADGT
jgi:hypothetical protein